MNLKNKDIIVGHYTHVAMQAIVDFTYKNVLLGNVRPPAYNEALAVENFSEGQLSSIYHDVMRECPDVYKTAYAEIVRCVKNGTAWLLKYQELIGGKYTCKSIETEKTIYGGRGRIDLLFTFTDNSAVIIDWKTGRAKSSDYKQLYEYAYYLLKAGLQVSRFVIMPVYLKGLDCRGTFAYSPRDAEKKFKSPSDIMAWAKTNASLLCGNPSDRDPERCAKLVDTARDPSHRKCALCKNCTCLAFDLFIQKEREAVLTEALVKGYKDAEIFAKLNAIDDLNAKHNASAKTIIRESAERKETSLPPYYSMTWGGMKWTKDGRTRGKDIALSNGALNADVVEMAAPKKIKENDPALYDSLVHSGCIAENRRLCVDHSKIGEID